MEVKVTVTHELGEETKKFIAGLLSGVAAAPASNAKAAKPAAPSKENTDEEAEEEKPATRTKRGAAKPAKEVEETPVEETEEDEAPKGRARRTSKAAEEAKPAAKTRSRKPAEKVADEPVFADMTDDEKLDEIKAKITLTTKKKGGADDVREILGVFDAGRAGELDAKDYDEFYDALTRYSAGESVDEIFPEVD